MSRALVEIYQDPLLADALVFRGGTALHKLLLSPTARYSEDLDFVQRESAPVTLHSLRLTFFARNRGPPGFPLIHA